MSSHSTGWENAHLRTYCNLGCLSIHFMDATLLWELLISLLWQVADVSFSVILVSGTKCTEAGKEVALRDLVNPSLCCLRIHMPLWCLKALCTSRHQGKERGKEREHRGSPFPLTGSGEQLSTCINAGTRACTAQQSIQVMTMPGWNCCSGSALFTAFLFPISACTSAPTGLAF